MNTLNHKQIASSQLFDEFKQCTDIQYNGQLKLISSEGKIWSFYYRLGQLVWSTGGTHTSRRLRRNMSQHCSNINIDKLHLLSANIPVNYEDNENVEYWDYLILQNLYKAKLITTEQLNVITENTISELLFDIAQQVNYTSLRCQRNQDVILDAPLTSTSANMFFKQMEKCWQKWVEAGLAIYSPNLAPILQQPERLKKQVSPTTYKNVENLINGKHSLWDLSVKMKRDVLSVASWLLPLIRQEIAGFIEVSDLPLSLIRSQNKNSVVSQVKRSNIPLIACVDDSSYICEMMEQIVTSHGMRFLKIKDSVTALPILIEHKPDFIFLDLIMPVLNGYELCGHLRRSNVLAKTPIVILTASDGAFDQVRSKLFGANDFINKPIDKNTVINIIHHYLSSKPANNPISINANYLQTVAV